MPAVSHPEKYVASGGLAGVAGVSGTRPLNCRGGTTRQVVSEVVGKMVL